MRTISSHASDAEDVVELFGRREDIG